MDYKAKVSELIKNHVDLDSEKINRNTTKARNG